MGELSARYARGIHDFLSRLVLDPAAAEDLTRSTFARAWERRSTLRDSRRVRAWLYAIAHGLAMRHATRARPVDAVEAAAGARIEDAGVGPDEAAVAQEIADLVWASACTLEARQYAVLDLAARRRMQAWELAEVLDVPVARASVMVTRARAALANAVRDLLVTQQVDQCPQLAALVPAALRMLAADRRLAVDDHVRGCPACRRVGVRLADPAGVLGSLVPLPVSPLLAEALTRLVAGVRRAHVPAPTPSRPRRPGRAIAGAAVPALLLLAAGAISLLRPAAVSGPALRLPPAPPIVAGVPPPEVAPVPVTPDPTGTPVARVGPSPTPVLDASTSPPVTRVPPIPVSPIPPSPTIPPEPTPVPAPTPTSTPPVPRPTATPQPPFQVAAITVGGQRCEPAGLLDLSVVCDFDVSVSVLGAAGGEVVTGTLTATNDGASGGVQSAPFRLPVAQRGGSTVSATVTVRFALCAHGVATARTQPASSAPSNEAAFSGCGSILGLAGLSGGADGRAPSRP